VRATYSEVCRCSLESENHKDACDANNEDGYETDSSIESLWWCTGNRLPRSRGDDRRRSDRTYGPGPVDNTFRDNLANVDSREIEVGSSLPHGYLSLSSCRPYTANKRHESNVRKVGVIYKITAPNGKGYVGQTINFKRRMNGHKHRPPGKGGCSALSKAILKYGWSSMKVEILMDSVPVYDLDEMERLMIEEHKTYHADSPGGYNLTRGGDKNPVNDPLVAEKMQIMYKSTEWKSKQLSGYTDDVRKLISDSQRARQQRGGFKQLKEAGKLGLPLAHERKNTPEAKSKRKATWDAKREAKLAQMNPEKAALVRRQAELDSARFSKNGPRPGYREYQAGYRARKRAERDEKQLTPGNCEHRGTKQM